MTVKSCLVHVAAAMALIFILVQAWANVLGNHAVAWEGKAILSVAYLAMISVVVAVLAIAANRKLEARNHG